MADLLYCLRAIDLRKEGVDWLFSRDQIAPPTKEVEPFAVMNRGI